MKKTICLFALASMYFIRMQAQSTTNEGTSKDVAGAMDKAAAAKGDTSIKEGWKKGGTININLTEAGQNSYWTAVKGGNTSGFGIKGIIDYNFDRKKGKTNWLNSFRARYGGFSSTTYNPATNTTKKVPFAKNDDYLSFNSTYGKEFRKNWSFAGFFSLETQFDHFFMTPGYVKFGPGFLYRPNTHFSLLVSPLMANITTKLAPSVKNMALYGVDSGKTTDFGLGAYAQANLNYDLSKGINYKSVLTAYSNYLKNPGNVVLDWNNLITLTVNKYIGATISLNARYNDLEAKHLQTQHGIGIGLSYKL